MDAQSRDDGDSGYRSIYDNTTFQDAIEFDANTSGGGLGVESGMCVSASARMDTSNTSFTIQFNGAKTTKQTIVSASAGLTEEAQQYLQSQPGKFVEKYGAYFVAGYIYGKSCKASYSLQFSSMDMAVKFAASFNESGTELGFSSKTSASIQSSLSASHTQATVSASQNSLGFNAPTVSDIASLQALITAYDNTTPTDSPISIIVMPWQYLIAVDKVFTGINCDDITPVTDLMNNYIYIKNTANSFIKNQLYTGNTQLTNVRTIGSTASSAFKDLSNLIDSAVANGTKITTENGANLVVNGQSFPQAEAMIDTLNTSITRFALSWKAWVKPASGYQLSTTMTTLAGSPVSVSSDGATVDGSAGTYFSWSIDGNANWEGTRGTQAMSYAIASLPSAWNMAIVLDRALGTLHCVGRGVNQSLAQNPVSTSIAIRGNSNAKPCTDLTNPTLINCDLQGGYYLICPM